MEAKFNFALMLLVLLAMGNAASSLPATHLKSVEEDPSSINLYKLFNEYIGAILNQGIPALHVRPFDPLTTAAGFEVFQPNDPKFPDYVNLTTEVIGMVMAGFSDYDVQVAEIDADALSATLVEVAETVSVTSHNVSVEAIKNDGSLLQYQCTDVFLLINNGTFSSFKQLEVDGNILQVAAFTLTYTVGSLEVGLVIDSCTGDDELQAYLGELLLEVSEVVTMAVIPRELKVVSNIIRIVLDDIFALRNITDVDAPHYSHTEQQELTKAEVLGQAPVVRRFSSNADVQKRGNAAEDNRLNVKWNNLFSFF